MWALIIYIMNIIAIFTVLFTAVILILVIVSDKPSQKTINILLLAIALIVEIMTFGWLKI